MNATGRFPPIAGGLNAFRTTSASPAGGLNASEYDGTNDYATHTGAMTGFPSSKTYSIFFWFKVLDDSSLTRTVFSWGGEKMRIVHLSTDLIRFQGYPSANWTAILEADSDNTQLVADGWVPWFLSCDLAVPSFKMYRGDTDDGPASPAALTDDTIAAGRAADCAMGAKVGGSSKVDAAISEYWGIDSSIDWSTEANRRKFIDGSGNPVYLGSDGSTPGFGTPDFYYPDGDPTTDASGNGNTMTITGALVAADGPGV